MALQDLELVAKRDVFEGGLSAGPEGGFEREQDDFEPEFRLYVW